MQCGEIRLKKSMNRFTKVFFVSMNYNWLVFAGIFLCGSCFISCKEKSTPQEKVIVVAPEKMDDQVRHLLKNFLDYSASKNGKIDDSTVLYQLPALMNLYEQKVFAPQWSSSQCPRQGKKMTSRQILSGLTLEILI